MSNFELSIQPITTFGSVAASITSWLTSSESWSRIAVRTVERDRGEGDLRAPEQRHRRTHEVVRAEAVAAVVDAEVVDRRPRRQVHDVEVVAAERPRGRRRHSRRRQRRLALDEEQDVDEVRRRSRVARAGIQDAARRYPSRRTTRGRRRTAPRSRSSCCRRASASSRRCCRSRRRRSGGRSSRNPRRRCGCSGSRGREASTDRTVEEAETVSGRRTGRAAAARRSVFTAVCAARLPRLSSSRFGGVPAGAGAPRRARAKRRRPAPLERRVAARPRPTVSWRPCVTSLWWVRCRQHGPRRTRAIRARMREPSPAEAGDRRSNELRCPDIGPPGRY